MPLHTMKYNPATEVRIAALKRTDQHTGDSLTSWRSSFKSLKICWSSLVRSGCLFVLPLCMSAGLVAHADSITSFSFQGASVFYGMAGDANTVTGTATIDTTTGQVQSISFVADGLSFSGVSSQNGAEVFVGPSNAAFSFSAASLIGYTGSTFNLNGANDLYVGSLTAGSTLDSGTLTPAPVLDAPVATAITPEPASLLLMSTGLLGVALTLPRKRQPLAS